MWGHLSEAHLLDVLEGQAEAAARSHAETCARCRERLEAARSGLVLARQADAIPEPSPLYWEAFRRRVDRQIVGGATAPRRAWRPALATAAALAALIALASSERPVRQPAPPRTLPAWSALPPVAEDASFALLGELQPTEELVPAESAPQGLASAVAELSDAERRRFAEALEALLQAQRQGKKS